MTSLASGFAALPARAQLGAGCSRRGACRSEAVLATVSVARRRLQYEDAFSSGHEDVATAGRTGGVLLAARGERGRFWKGGWAFRGGAHPAGEADGPRHRRPAAPGGSGAGPGHRAGAGRLRLEHGDGRPRSPPALEEGERRPRPGDPRRDRVDFPGTGRGGGADLGGAAGCVGADPAGGPGRDPGESDAGAYRDTGVLRRRGPRHRGLRPLRGASDGSVRQRHRGAHPARGAQQSVRGRDDP